MTTKPESPDSGASDKEGGTHTPDGRSLLDVFRAEQAASAGDQAVGYLTVRSNPGATHRYACSFDPHWAGFDANALQSGKYPLYTRAQDAAGKGVEPIGYDNAELAATIEWVSARLRQTATCEEQHGKLLAQFDALLHEQRRRLAAKPAQVGQKYRPFTLADACELRRTEPK